jgi:hypothetical protein
MPASSHVTLPRLPDRAYHAAGHVVYAWYHGQRVDTVLLDITAPAHGSCHIPGPVLPEDLPALWRLLPDISHPWIQREVDIAIGSLLAGPLAEVRVQRRRLSGVVDGSADCALAWETAHAWREATGTPTDVRSVERFLFSMQGRVQRFLLRPKVWRAVTTVAEVLGRAGTLEGEALQGCLAAAYGRRSYGPLRPGLPQTL